MEKTKWLLEKKMFIDELMKTKAHQGGCLGEY
jgi:hypothetical protein